MADPSNILDALKAVGYAVVKLPDPLWVNDTTTSWRIYLNGEPEDVYRRGDVVTVSGAAHFDAEDVPDLAAALLASANAAETPNA